MGTQKNNLNITPCFIVGIGRSGTTLLTDMLNGNPCISAAPENNFILFGKNLSTRSGSNLIAEFKTLFTLNYNHTQSIWRPDLSFLEKYNINEKQIDYQELCKEVYLHNNPAKDQNQIKVFVDKNPVYSLYIKDLITLFPDAKFIILTRDFRDNIVSRKKHTEGTISKLCELAKAESLPGAPNPIPMLAPHLLDRTIKEGNDGKRISSTIDLELQQEVNRIVDYYHSVLENNEIHNIAALVLDVEKGTVLAYTGNSTCKEEGSGIAVDIIRAPRSTGSILKPFLYNFMLEEGTLLPHSLVPDIPTHIGGFSPKNFERSYDGVVPASEALARSLNIPAVKMLQEYGLEKFLYKIQSRGFSTIDKTSSHYGLSLILGGAEATLWDLSNEYMQMSQALLNTKTGRANYISTNSKEQEPKTEMTYDPAATWWTFEAMTSLNRPYQEIGWQKYKSAQKIAWKTGTSFGHRDAWAIGMTPKHVVGVWVGNADGEGRPGLTGLSSAAPILFKIIKHLPYKNWFQEPYMDLISVITCKESGFLASKACENVVELMVPENGENSTLCSYHTYIHLDAKMEYRVESNCYPVSDMKTKSWFVLPPVQEWYYKKRDPFYKVLPAYTPDCQPDRMNNMAVIYPQQRAKIFVPRQLDGTKGKAVFEITHRDNESTVYWHLDDNYVGNTRTLHKFELAPEVGTHIMTLVDEKGESLHWNFEVIEK